MPKPKTLYLKQVSNPVGPIFYECTRTVNTLRLAVGDTISRVELESILNTRQYDVIIDTPKRRI